MIYKLQLPQPEDKESKQTIMPTSGGEIWRKACISTQAWSSTGKEHLIS